jgi:hypothetical protein
VLAVNANLIGLAERMAEQRKEYYSRLKKIGSRLIDEE